jgi:hypothetical protein
VWDDPGVPLDRIAWLVTVGICALAVVLLLVSGYQGYAGVTGAVGLSAAINLR